MNYLSVAKTADYIFKYYYLFMIFFLFPTNVIAGVYCSKPSVPSFYDQKPIKPSVPFCVNDFMKTHTCDDFTISQYNSEVETYNSRLRSYNSSVEIYIAELNRYVRKARDYAQCEVDNL